MDINKLFRSADMSCGRVLKILPEAEIGSPKQYLQEILEVKTLPSLNELYPYIDRVQINTTHLETIIDKSDPYYIGYRIPLSLTNGLKIMSVKALHCGTGATPTDGIYESSAAATLGRGLRMAAYPNKYGRYGSSHLYETVMLANLSYADNMLLGQVQEAPVPRFQPPNIIWINKSYGSAGVFTATLCLENDKNLLTIPDDVFEGVRRLFVLDVKSTVYSQYGMLSSIETALGTLDLKIDDWSSAENERMDLFDQYKSMAHLRKHTIKNG
jgi:hypothetical protein